jgi:hypothetical protein
MRYLLLLTFLATLPAHAEGLCHDGESALFQCATKKLKWISVCTGPVGVRYRFGKKGAEELSLPAASYNLLTYSGGGGAYVRFPSGTTDYIVFSRFVKGSGDSSGVLIRFGGKKKAVQVRCAKQTELDFSSLEKLALKRDGAEVDPFAESDVD